MIIGTLTLCGITSFLRDIRIVLRANIGCGPTPTEGWVNVDNSPSILIAKSWLLTKLALAMPFVRPGQKSLIKFARTHEIVHANASRHLPFKSSSVDVLYSCHMLEHLDLADAKSFLGEAKRVSKPDGILRIVVPDLSMLIEKYNNTKDADYFMQESLLSVPTPKGLLQKLKYAFLTGFRHHLWLYDKKSLVGLLNSAGFSTVILEAGHTTIPDAGSLDLFERADCSIFVEATAVSASPR